MPLRMMIMGIPNVGELISTNALLNYCAPKLEDESAAIEVQ
jgi:hypothetical protein